MLNFVKNNNNFNCIMSVMILNIMVSKTKY